jgi:hypothetical protein
MSTRASLMGNAFAFLSNEDALVSNAAAYILYKAVVNQGKTISMTV